MKILMFIERRWWSFIGTIFGILGFLGISIINISGIFMQNAWIFEVLQWIFLAIAMGFSFRSYVLTRLDIPTLIFFDNIGDTSSWNKHGEGEVYKSAEYSWSEKYSLKKDKHSDPHGGYKMIGKKITRPFIFSGWIYRSDIDRDRGADRLAIEDENYNGYGFCISHSTRTISIERREGGIGTFAINSGQPTPPLDKWYHFQFYIGSSGRLFLSLSDHSGIRIIGDVSGKDKKYKSFDRIVVHGGYPYYIDDVKIMSI